MVREDQLGLDFKEELVEYSLQERLLSQSDQEMPVTKLRNLFQLQTVLYDLKILHRKTKTLLPIDVQ